MKHERGERRRAPRATGPDTIVAARVRPGRDVVVINISRDGALIETAHRLLPGATVDLQLDESARRIVIRGRVLRCSVAAVRPALVVYRGAIAFDRALLPAQDDAPMGGNGVPDAAEDLAAPGGASNTRGAGR